MLRDGWAHAEVLARIDRTAGHDGNLVESVEQLDGGLALIGKVHGQGEARSRKGEKPRGGYATETVQLRPYGPMTGTAGCFEQPRRGLRRGRNGIHALMLAEATPPVEPAPPADRVERVKVGSPRLRRHGLTTVVLAKAVFVQHFQRHAVEQTEGRRKRHGEPRPLRDIRIFASAVGVIRGEQDAPPHAPSRRELVEPGYGILVLLFGPFGQREISIETIEAKHVPLDMRRRHLHQPKLDVEDQPGQSQAAIVAAKSSAFSSGEQTRRWPVERSKVRRRT